MKKIAILGSTGSIGTQTLDVISNNSNEFKIELISANSNYKLLIKQAIKYTPKTIIFGNKKKSKLIEDSLAHLNINIIYGEDALNSFIDYCDIDIVVTALVGKSGLIPTITAIKNNIDIAIANKETLVIAGSYIRSLLKNKRSNIYPIDSEHSAIFQCLQGEEKKSIEKLILTASGGPFRGKDIDFLKNVTKEEALRHPNWVMGNKVTIDSSTLMNKVLEVIEARFLFDIEIKNIEVIIHPESIIHSMVQFKDGSIIAQLGEPDMRLPIQYALGYPKRIENTYPRFDFNKSNSLNFEEPSFTTFRNLKLAYQAGENEGNSPCILNASNEIVVSAFLNGKIKFLDMTNLIEDSLNKISYIASPNLEQLIETDLETRKYTLEKINKK